MHRGFDAPNVLTIDGEQTIWFNRDEIGNLRLNIRIRDVNRNEILLMEDNDWIIHPPNLFDLKCSPQGKELEIISNDETTKFKIRFEECNMDKLNEILLKIQLPTESMKKRGVPDKEPNQNVADEFISHIGTPDSITLCSFEGNLTWAGSLLKFNEYDTELPMNSFLNGVIMKQASGIFSFNTKMGIGFGGQ